MSIPTHIAIIPDGNRRWAKQRGLPAFTGHREGAKTTEKILTVALKLGIPNLTFWGASVGNVTKRSAKEVQFLFKLFTAYFKKITKAKLIHQNKVHINAFGEWQKYFPKETQAAIQEALITTKEYGGFQLTFLLAYSGVEEMAQAVRQIVADTVGANGRLPPPTEEVGVATIKQHLYTKES